MARSFEGYSVDVLLIAPMQTLRPYVPDDAFRKDIIIV